MSDFRKRVSIGLTFLALGWLIWPSAPWAQGLPLRKAATPPAREAIPADRPTASEESGDLNQRTRIGLSPLPYHPEGREPRQEVRTSRLGQYPDIRNLVKKINRSVVSIRMLDASSKFSLGKLGFSGDSASKAMGYGSGFLVSQNGHIMTNEHVLRNGSVIEVELLSGEKYAAKVLLRDKKNDLALLKIDAKNLQPVKLGDSEGVELGEWVIGIGNPYGIGQSIMIGIVSAQRRQIPGSGYPPLIQIDAAMNLGNSGGPLFNMEGEVVGINTILLWKSQGIGFATPINVARQFLEQNTRGWARAASASSGPQEDPEPLYDDPRPTPQSFNPLDPPWKFNR